MIECLIYFQFSSLESKEKLKAFIQKIQTIISVEKVSSVFKRNKNSNSRLDDLQEFVIKAKTKIPAHEITEKIKAGNEQIQTAFQMELLSYGDEIKITPLLTLPHPKLFLDSLILHCSAEIWPDFIHPIQSKTLRVVDQEKELPKLEFLYQGKYFLD